jgi:hypothetical protein
MCKTHIPLTGTKTWKFPKFHELLHILDDMEQFGAPVNLSAQRLESLLIVAAKQPGRWVQNVRKVPILNYNVLTGCRIP